MADPDHRLRDDSLNHQHTAGGPDSAVSPPGTPPDEAVSLRSRYRILRTLGKGGMGEVLLARDTVLDRSVAIKRVNCHLNPHSVQRFLREARMIARLNDPHIVQLFDIRQSNRGPVIIMEYVDGTSLREALRSTGRFELSRGLQIIRQAAAGLAAAHAGGIIHRDIKPGNILLTSDGIAKLGDFGLAAGQCDDQLTASRGLLGTPLYAAPEQIADPRQSNARSDLYSLGLTMYEILTGRAPRQIRTDALPAPVAGLIQHLTQEDPTNRLASAAELITQIDRLTGALAGGSQDECARKQVMELAASGYLADALRIAHQLRQSRDQRIAVWAANACRAIQERIALGPVVGPQPPSEPPQVPPSKLTPLETDTEVDLSLENWNSNAGGTLGRWLKRITDGPR